MSTPGNTAKLGTVYSNIQKEQSCPSLVFSKPTINALVCILLSSMQSPQCQPADMGKMNKF